MFIEKKIISSYSTGWGRTFYYCKFFYKHLTSPRSCNALEKSKACHIRHALPVIIQISILFATLQGTIDDFVLYTHMQLGKERAKTCYPNHEVAVFFGVLLGIP